MCRICDFKSKSKKGLRIHTVKSHSVGSIENNYKVLVYHGGGLREDNQIKYITCNICGFKKEDTGFTDRSLCGQTFKEMEEHVKSDHKEAFDYEVIGWQGGFIKWNNWSM